jgi:hypothetical protein
MGKQIESRSGPLAFDQSRGECPDEAWWLHDLLDHAADRFERAQEQAAVKNRVSELPAALVREGGESLQVAAKRLAGSGAPDLFSRYGLDRKVVIVALQLARKVSAKAAAGLTVGEALRLKGQPTKWADGWDSLDDDRPKRLPPRIDFGRPQSQEYRERAIPAVLALEELELLVSRDGLPADDLGDFVDLADRAHAAGQRLVREIERRFSQNPVLRHIAGRSPRRRTPRRPRKAAAQKIDKATPEDQGADS